jgi:anti-sigma regulatory factor (Ser/Thr protein kinase)
METTLDMRLGCMPGGVIQAAYAPSVAGPGIGGDWYDVFTLPDGRIAMSVGDAVGRGLPAAVIMGQVRQSIRAAALGSDPPFLVLDRAGAVLRLTHESEGMATAMFGIFDPVSLTFSYSSAGHPAPLLAHAEGRVESLPAGGLPLGVRTPNVHPAWTIQIPRGSLLVLYTDGLVESRRDLLEGEGALLAAVAAEAVRPSADMARAILTRTIPGGTRPDDVAIIALRILGPEASRFTISARATLMAARTMRNALRQFLAEQRIDPDRAAEIQVAVGEAVNNAIEHAYGAAAGLVHLSGWIEGPSLVVEVRDHGRWRPERDERRGHGVNIMRSLADRLDLNTTPTGTVVRLMMAMWSDGSAVTAGA